MTSDDHVSDEQARRIFDLINQRKELLVTGITGMRMLKKTLAYAIKQAGLKIEWDPSTPAAIRERLTIVSLSALQWSFAGATAGLIVGVCTEKPDLWTGVGAGIAALLGAYQGHCAVRCGWRLRGFRDEHGVEYVEIKVHALPRAVET